MVILYIVLIVVFFIILFLVAGGVIFHIAVNKKGKTLNLTDFDFIKGTEWEKYYDMLIQNEEIIKKYEYEEVSVKSHDGLLLSGKLFLAKEPLFNVVMFHGYHSLSESNFAKIVEYFIDKRGNILLVDQRAHAKSEGKYIGFGILERYDVISWVDYLNQRFKDMPVLLQGISMGASTVLMASGITQNETIKGIVADCAYTSPWEVLKFFMKSKYNVPAFPLLHIASMFSKIFAKYSFKEYSTIEALKVNKYPVIFIHGKKDDFVPYEMSVQNYNACKSPKKLITVENAGHGCSFFEEPERLAKEMDAFLKEYVTNI